MLNFHVHFCGCLTYLRSKQDLTALQFGEAWYPLPGMRADSMAWPHSAAGPGHPQILSAHKGHSGTLGVHPQPASGSPEARSTVKWEA